MLPAQSAAYTIFGKISNISQMKKRTAYHLFFIVFAGWLACSCVRVEEPDISGTNGEVQLTFGVVLPEETVVATRGVPVEPGQLQSLHILVFDQNGSFLARYPATEGSSTGVYTVRMAPTDPD